jgi:ABC-type dipeptide/oligopeptide/nickel transport system ATPase subunit
MTVQSPAGPAIHVQGLEKSYGKKAVLRGVDLDVTRGSIFALLGSNGAGKTTTDAAVLEASAGAERILALLEERGWKGWTRIERIPADRVDALSPRRSAAPADELDRAVDEEQDEGAGAGEQPALVRRPTAAQ